MFEYDEEDFLALSGLQHFAFCRRQWALINIEQQWQENLRTVEGHLFHERAHDDRVTEKRGDMLISRGMPIFSRSLGVRGVCDVVEFRQNDEGVALQGRKGRWLPVPVEYKRGAPKAHDADALQLCGQAMCLEEMLVCSIPQAYLYYGETKHRTAVLLDQALRQRVQDLLAEMHGYFARHYTPRVKFSKSCRACSLADVCLPQLGKVPSAKDYTRKQLEQEA